MDIEFVVSDPKNLVNQNYSKIRWIYNIWSTILDPPFLILKNWQKISGRWPKKYKITATSDEFTIYRLPHWIRHCEFRKTDQKFVRCDPEDPDIPNYSKIRVYNKNYLPHWIRHLELWKTDNGFMISDPKIL